MGSSNYTYQLRQYPALQRCTLLETPLGKAGVRYRHLTTSSNLLTGVHIKTACHYLGQSYDKPWQLMFLSALYTSFRAAILCVIQYFHLFTSQRVSIGRISLSQLTLYDVKYAGTLYGGKYHPEFSVCSTHFQFHLLAPSLPRWLTMVSEGIVYTSETGDVSVDRSSVTLWIFPVLFKQTAGPWVNINMEGVKIRIPNGKSTPHFVKQLRKNLVGTLVCGEIYRVDNFGTKIIFAGLTDRDAGAGNDNQHDDNKRHQETSSDIHTSSRSQTKDELRISSFLRGLHLHNTEGRIYTFGEVDAQLRRNWIESRGSFVMVAKESRWLRVHWPYQRLKTIPTWV